MRAKNTQSLLGQALFGATVALGSMLALSAHAAAPGITGPTFNLSAGEMRVNQPNGKSLYSWGYGCTGTPSGYAPAGVRGANCPAAQLPGPTLIVTEGQTVTVILTNALPSAAGSTSILFPGFQVTALTGTGTTGLLAQEAPNLASCVTAGCNTVTYTFTASTPGTHSYYSGTQGDLQVEMGMYGALIVLPKTVPANCNSGLAASNLIG